MSTLMRRCLFFGFILATLLFISSPLLTKAGSQNFVLEEASINLLKNSLTTSTDDPAYKSDIE